MARAAFSDLLLYKSRNKCRLYFPNICMAELSKVFAKNFLKRRAEKTKAVELYRSQMDGVLASMSRKRGGRLFIPLTLERDHLVDLEDIFVFERETPSRDSDDRGGGKDNLSPIDAIILSMARKLADEHGRDDILVVTKEAWLATVCNKNREHLPRAVNVATENIPVL